jgi:16S rRNA (cytosine1402-N4)-methyltransferase
MSEIFHQHVPVLLDEAVAHLFNATAANAADGIYIDATFGRGSHSQAILDRLSAKGRLLAFDKDKAAVAYAQHHFARDPRFTIFHRSYAELQACLTPLQLFGKINGILFDLGVSSPQLEDPERGFSFSKEGPLDMRMDQGQGMDAAAWLAKVSEAELAQVLWHYGEERFSRRIARAIVNVRRQTPITTTRQLADMIKCAVPKIKGAYDKHPATRSFQAIRIVINRELADLEAGLAQAVPALLPSGRLAVISFHSLEDRIVKQFIRQQEKGPVLPRGLPIKAQQVRPVLKSIGKPIKPGPLEIAHNPRARSAILRIAEKQP